MVIYQNKYYEVRVLRDDPEEFSYEVVNTEYETTEHKTHTLPAAVKVALGLCEERESIEPLLNPEAEVSSLSLVETTKPH